MCASFFFILPYTCFSKWRSTCTDGWLILCWQFQIKRWRTFYTNACLSSSFVELRAALMRNCFVERIYWFKDIRNSLKILTENMHVYLFDNVYHWNLAHSHIYTHSFHLYILLHFDKVMSHIRWFLQAVEMYIWSTMLLPEKAVLTTN